MGYPRYSEEKEFEILRSELLQGKRYVFERPILIISGSIAFVHSIDKQYAVYFPMLIIGLMFFNLWFTINRMGSMARIIAYIQIVLENKEMKWYGWETSLRNYRKWLKQNASKKLLPDNSSVYDSLGYFPTIFYLHVIVNIAITILMAFYTIKVFNNTNLVLCCIVFGEILFFLIYAIKKRPTKVKLQIENNRLIWFEVFNDWKKLSE